MSTDSQSQGWSSGGVPSGRVLSGKFRVRELLGAGGMGAVYVAEHAVTRRVGALKLLHPSFAELPETRERFLREASAAGLIGNPHIVETYDAGTLESEEPYIFMELLAGSSLDNTLRAQSHLGLDDALDITIQAARALHAAHQAGIIHRDIKPANLFLLEGPRPFVKVLDFGISKFAPADEEVPHDLTRDGALLGTPVYMSPEQVMGHRDLDARTDVYSLAVVLYELLTGEAPFHGSSLMQLSANICLGNYSPPSQSRGDLPPGMEAVLAKALHRDRDERFASAEAFAEALAEFCPERAEEPALAPPRTSERVSARASNRPSARSSDRASARPSSGARGNDHGSFVEAPTLEPHSTTDRAPRALLELPRRSTSKRALWVGATLLVAFAIWFAIRGGPGPADTEPHASASGEGLAGDHALATSASIAPLVGSGEAVAREQRDTAATAPSPTPSTTATVRPPKTKARESGSPESTKPPATAASAERDGLTVTNPFH